MEVFRPFRATVQRHQKYYSQKRQTRQMKGSIFNLPRQVIGKRSLSVINPQCLPNKILSQKQDNKFVSAYQSNLKKTAKKHSKEILNHRALEKAITNIISNQQEQQNKNQSLIDPLKRNKSTQYYTNKNMAFKTLNILYRTIIQTKVRRKSRQNFQLNAKKLPIIQKNMQSAKRVFGKLSQNSSFEKLKMNLTTINNEGMKGSLVNSDRNWKGIQNIELQNRESQRMMFKQRRVGRGIRERDGEYKNMNEIIPWGQNQAIKGLAQNEWYY